MANSSTQDAKQVVVTFEWTNGITTASGPSYVLKTRIGSLPVGRDTRLFSDERGFYNGDASPLSFCADLSIAMQQAEQTVLQAMNAQSIKPHFI